MIPNTVRSTWVHPLFLPAPISLIVLSKTGCFFYEFFIRLRFLAANRQNLISSAGTEDGGMRNELMLTEQPFRDLTLR